MTTFMPKSRPHAHMNRCERARPNAPNRARRETIATAPIVAATKRGQKVGNQKQRGAFAPTSEDKGTLSIVDYGQL
jgi:hypothetical protein